MEGIEPQLNFQKSAKFNQAVLQQGRINKLIEQIEYFNKSPLTFNQDFLEYNYVLMFNNMIMLLGTIKPKFSKADDKIIMQKFFLLKDFMESHPVFVSKTNGNKKKETRMIKERWKLLSRTLYFFYLDLQDSMEKYGWGNPDKENPYLAAAKQ